MSVSELKEQALQKAQEMSRQAADVAAKGQEVVPEQAKTLFQRLKSMGYKRWALVLATMGGVLTALATPVLLVVGLPALVLVGGILLLFSPLILVTSPLWIPVVLFFLTVGGVLAATVAAIFGLWWLYRYFRGPMPPGGKQLYRVKEYVRGVVQRTTGTIAKKGHQITDAMNITTPSST
ncbi:hypothetical protein CBR_g30795 [Chara braunii]|uniref:Oleosin n=1 Tax=Chara braunii TaxID=69332 RepID=A0A388JXC1_CHABU|nr:hypothetical protein CBR_g30795 [Chara braunii]|eukprot:GBG62474.1 hypothetical protein CBR_g30795 [Chara braunii]